jgi:pimeloyl-ACP methyl ester carboxylesterase
LPTTTPLPPVKAEPVYFVTGDGLRLDGNLYSSEEAGETAVLLAHMGLSDQRSWSTFARQIAGMGWPALTFDFRCFGRSDCDQLSGGNADALYLKDIRTAARYLRSQGYARIVCMGASLGGSACMNLALEEELAGLVIIASGNPYPISTKRFPDDLISPAMPKLFIVAEQDRYTTVVYAIPQLYERSPEPKELHILPETAHGTELFGTASADEFRQLLIEFLQGLALSHPPTANISSRRVLSLDTVAQIETLHLLSGHTEQIFGLAFSPDGQLLASASADGTVKFWDVASGQELHTLHHEGGVCGLAISSDGRLLASGGLDGLVKVWDVEGRQEAHTLSGHGGAVCGLSISPEGTLLATGSVDQSVRLWHLESGQLLHTLAGHTSVVFSAAFSPDGSLLASGSARPELHIKLWDVETGQEVRTLVGQETDVHDLAFSPDGTLLASVGPMAEVKLWDVGRGQVIHNLRGHNGNVFGVAFSADSTLMASSSDDGTVKLWNVETGRALHSLRHGGEGMQVVFAPDGTLLANDGADNQVYLWGVPE